MDDDLIHHIHDLPPELFHQIKSEVINDINLEPGDDGFHYEHVTAAYNYPTLLHLSRSSRKELAKRYFGNTILVFPSRKLFHTSILAMDQKLIVEMRGMRVSSFPESIFDDLEWDEDFLDQLGATFTIPGYFMLTTLTMMGEKLGCLENKYRVLPIIRSEDEHSWNGRLYRVLVRMRIEFATSRPRVNVGTERTQ